jgi:hypothetical protein
MRLFSHECEKSGTIPANSFIFSPSKPEYSLDDMKHTRTFCKQWALRDNRVNGGLEEDFN